MLADFVERLGRPFRGPRVRRAQPGALDPEEFRDFFRRDCLSAVIAVDGRRYYAKRCRSEAVAGRAILAAGLLDRIMNVPRAIIPVPALQTQVESLLGQGPWVLVRLCQDHHARSLPIRNRTEAVAAELAFSTWINRRDAHNSNRCYRDGIPMFFDFDHAFAPNAGATGFFRPGPDPGFTQNWRLLLVDDHVSIDTVAIREQERQVPYTLHPVQDADAFGRHLRAYGEVIRGFSPAAISTNVQRAFLDPGDRDAMIAFLVEEQKLLPEKLATVSDILARPLPEAAKPPRLRTTT